MLTRLKAFITKLQNSDEATKLRWVIIFTSVSAVLIIGSALLIGGNPVNSDDRPSLLTRIGIGTSRIVDGLRERTANTIYFFSEKINKTNEIAIKPEAPATEAEKANPTP